MNSAPRDILVTGAGSGLGLAIAEYLAGKGDRVVGTVRSPTKAQTLTEQAAARGLPLRYVALELSDYAQVDEVAARFLQEGGVEVVVHNAGAGIFGPVEEIDEAQVEKQFAVNLFGPMRLNRRLMPDLRRRSGRIIWVGSMAGRFALPFQAHYSASKAAMATFSDALRMEVESLGVKVTCIEPGDFATSFPDSRVNLTREGSPYEALTGPCLEAAEAQERGGPGPEWMARAVDEVSRQTRPPARLPVGRFARTLCTLKDMVPNRLTEKVLRSMFGLK